MDFSDLAEKIVVITGATTGIGEATAVELAKHGSKLVLCGRNLDGLNDTKEQCLQKGLEDQDVVIVTGDICEENTLDLIVKTSVDAFGRVDVLILNAGKVHPNNNTVLDVDSNEGLDFYFNLFVKSQYKLTQKLAAELIKVKGSIIFISSNVVQELLHEAYPCDRPRPGIEPRPSKQNLRLISTELPCPLMVDAITRGNSPPVIIPGPSHASFLNAPKPDNLFMLQSCCRYDVQVICIESGLVKTPFFKETQMSSEEKDGLFNLSAIHTPLSKSLPTAEEIGRVVVFLASDQSACLTGAVLTADKGLTMAHPAVDWKQF